MIGATPKQRLALRLALYGGAFFLVLPGVFAFIMTRTYRAPVSPNPPPRYTEVRLVSDGLRLRAWVARGETGRPAVIIVHGLGDTLESYQEHAQPFLDRGHTVLLLDLRGHGGSEGATTTLGGRESEDVRSAMSYLKAEGLAGNGYVLMGHSMGAVAVLLAAADRTDVRAVIAEAPFDTYRSTVTHHARLLYGLPSWVPLIPLSVQGAEWIAGFDADDVDAVAAASRIQAPLLAIVDGDDRRMPEPVVRRIVDAHRGPHRLWVATGVGHVGAIYHRDWKSVVLGFLDEHPNVGPSPSGSSRRDRFDIIAAPSTQSSGIPMDRKTPRSTCSISCFESSPPRACSLRRSLGRVVICSHFRTQSRGTPPCPLFRRT